ncbi:thiamine phosphate synthase [Faecalimonas sp.]
MNCSKETMLLYAVTDRSWIGKQTLLEQVECALNGGATCIQLREKELGEDEFLSEALAIKQLCQKYRVPLLINDNVDIAVRCDADGVHVGQCDMEVGKVRSLLGDDKIIGVSARTMEQALEAEEAGADYLGVGAVFSTKTKLDANTISHKTLREICNAVKIPVVAIGGINKENILELSGSGVAGVALVSAIFGAIDIEKECKVLTVLSKEMLGK